MSEPDTTHANNDPAASRERLEQQARAQLESEQRLLDSLIQQRTELNAEITIQTTRVARLTRMIGEPLDAGSRTGTRATSPTGRTPQPHSKIARAYTYLREKGDSRHVKEILPAIGEPDTSQARNALASQINRYAEQGRLFARDPAMGRRYFHALDTETTAGPGTEHESPGPVRDET